MTHMSTLLVLLSAWAAVVLSTPLHTRQAPQPCTCVPFHLCVNDTVVTDGDKVLDERFLSVATTSPPELNPCNDSEVCCKTPAEEHNDTLVAEQPTTHSPPGEGAPTFCSTQPPITQASHEVGAPSEEVTETTISQASPAEVVPTLVTGTPISKTSPVEDVPTEDVTETTIGQSSSAEEVSTEGVTETLITKASPGEALPTEDITEPPTSHGPHGEAVPTEGVTEQPISQASPGEGAPSQDVTETPITKALPEEVAPKHNVVEPPTTPPHIHVQKCGLRNITEGLNTRILGTSDKKPNELDFPWQAALFVKDEIKNRFLCGGTLIASRFVMTAAHYVTSVNIAQLKVRLGEYDLQSDVEEFPHQDIDTSEIIIHPEFKKGPNFNDIALVHLAQPAKFAPNINTACLPKAGIEYPSGKTCTVSGWGKTFFAVEALYSNITKAADVPLVDNKKCQELLRKTRLGRFFILHSSFLCAGGEKGKDSCTGDGGGPLVCEENGVYSVAGIVSWGIGCGEENVPGVYVKVSQFTTWIEEIIAARTLE